MSFSGSPGAMTVSTEVSMSIKLGPVPVFKYRHRAVERWSGGRFTTLETSTNLGGKQQMVVARRTETGVLIETGRGKITAPASALPLTHWNSDALSGPLFNPQEGKLLKITARRLGGEQVTSAAGRAFSATRWSVRGEAEIDNWYDNAGVWAALKGRLPDGSTMEYRRI